MTERTFSRTSTATGAPRILETVIWYPTDSQTTEPGRNAAPASGGPFPVVVFSHGSSGDPAQASYLTEHLAFWGFIVVAAPHPGNTRQDRACDIVCLGASYVERLPDVLSTLDQVFALADKPTEPLATLVDPERAAVTGFSFGAMTAIRTGPERRFDAIVGIAPAAPASLIGIGKQLDVPVLGERR